MAGIRSPAAHTALALVEQSLVPTQNDDRETITLSTNPQFVALIERSRRRQDTERGISSGEMRRRLRIGPAGARKKSVRGRSR